MVTGTRSRFTRTNYLLEVEVETYKVQLRTQERLTSCITGTKIQEQGNRGPKGTKSQRVKGELA